MAEICVPVRPVRTGAVGNGGGTNVRVGERVMYTASGMVSAR